MRTQPLNSTYAIANRPQLIYIPIDPSDLLRLEPVQQQQQQQQQQKLLSCDKHLQQSSAASSPDSLFIPVLHYFIALKFPRVFGPLMR
jgi:hypothetical protein